MIDKKTIKKGNLNYTITLMVFLLSVNLLAKGNTNYVKKEKLVPMVNIKTSNGQITPSRAFKT